MLSVQGILRRLTSWIIDKKILQRQRIKDARERLTEQGKKVSSQTVRVAETAEQVYHIRGHLYGMINGMKLNIRHFFDRLRHRNE